MLLFSPTSLRPAYSLGHGGLFLLFLQKSRSSDLNSQLPLPIYPSKSILSSYSLLHQRKKCPPNFLRIFPYLCF